LVAQVLRTILSSLLLAGFHYYVWRRIVHDPQWSQRVRRFGTVALALMYCAVPATVISGRLGAAEVATILGWVAMPWMVAVGLTMVWLIGFDLLRAARALVGLPRRWRRRRAANRAAADEVADPTRRLFLARAASGTAVLATATSVSAGVLAARGVHQVVTVEVPIARLPRALDGFSIVQLTDLHVGTTIDRHFVRRVVERSNAERPDLIALTGDLVEGWVDDVRDEAAPLAELRAPHGVFAVPGNHEYYWGADAWLAELRRLGVRPLRNERVEVGRRGASFDLAGIDDHSAHRFPGHGADLAAAVRGRDPSRALVLLAHQPRQVADAMRHDVDLQLSGHTHGGQVWPWHYLARAQQGGLLAGMYQRGATRVYVSRGCGYFGPPVRLGAPLEITKIILRASGAAS
jgi:uncharacterized protein